MAVARVRCQALDRGLAAHATRAEVLMSSRQEEKKINDHNNGLWICELDFQVLMIVEDLPVHRVGIQTGVEIRKTLSLGCSDREAQTCPRGSSHGYPHVDFSDAAGIAKKDVLLVDERTTRARFSGIY